MTEDVIPMTFNHTSLRTHRGGIPWQEYRTAGESGDNSNADVNQTMVRVHQSRIPVVDALFLMNDMSFVMMMMG
jgi:hypothetical protein